MKIEYGTSLPAPETVSEISRLTREAYDQIRVESVGLDRRTFLGGVAAVLGARVGATTRHAGRRADCAEGSGGVARFDRRRYSWSGPGPGVVAECRWRTVFGLQS